MTTYLNSVNFTHLIWLELENLFKHDWSQFEQEKFKSDYLNHDWNSIFELHGFNPESCFDIFNGKMKNLLDRHIPKVGSPRDKLRHN